ncbi:MAG: GNAT family N-acetyltransferase [Bacteroidales bacterium]|nr:GNAT family N-acetyltransferase [Bacteroidales bacterium]
MSNINFTPEITHCTLADFSQITSEIEAFWGSDRTLAIHHPSLIYEFGDTAFVIRKEGQVIAYLFGYYSQTESTAYIHLIATREGYQKMGLGQVLYSHFIAVAKANKMTKIKAITRPFNTKSINFHTRKIGMKMLGEPNQQGTSVVKNYSGIGEDRVVFEKEI